MLATPSTLIALLRSPHFRFQPETTESGDAESGDAEPGTAQPELVTRESVSALDRALSAARYLGELERLARVTDGLFADTGESYAPIDAELYARISSGLMRF